MPKSHYEVDDTAFPADAYSVDGWKGIAFYVLGWRTEPDEETEWSGFEKRTGDVVCMMVGDDCHWVFEPEEIHPLEREEYCCICGQIGCRCDGYDRSDENA